MKNQTRKLIPMLFSTPMALANMQGRKTESRRITKALKPYNHEPHRWVVGKEYVSKKNGGLYFPMFEKSSSAAAYPLLCPYGKPGDVLWMRESYCPEYFQFCNGSHTYKADWPEVIAKYLLQPRWTPSIHMPLTACRFFALITEISLERLKDITEEGAVAEGIQPIVGETEAFLDYKGYGGSYASAEGSYYSLWESIHGVGTVKQNPYVWVVKYQVLPVYNYPFLIRKDFSRLETLLGYQKPHLLPKDSLDNVLKGEAQP